MVVQAVILIPIVCAVAKDPFKEHFTLGRQR